MHAGAKLVIVVNPLVPYVNDFTEEISTPFGTRPRHVSDMGLAQIGYQTFKLLAYQRLHEMARQWEQKYPDVDILLIEPEPDDELMFQTSIMDFTKRVEIARHGFQSVTLKLTEDYDDLQGGPRPPRHRDLRHARAQGRQARHPREGEDAGLAAHPRADDRHAAAPVGLRGRRRRRRGAVEEGLELS